VQGYHFVPSRGSSRQAKGRTTPEWDFVRGAYFLCLSYGI